MPFDDTTQSVRLTRLTTLADMLEALTDESDHIFNMGCGFEYGVDYTPGQALNHECGTVGCIAGYAIKQAAIDPVVRKAVHESMLDTFSYYGVSGRKFTDWPTVKKTAQEYLHLSASEAFNLFLPDTPDGVDRLTASDAAHAIRRLIDGKLPWPQFNEQRWDLEEENA